MEDAIENPHWIIENEKLEDFMQHDLNDMYCHLGEVKEAIDKVKVVKNFRKFTYIDKIICFIYSAIMNFCQNDRVKCKLLSEIFVWKMSKAFCIIKPISITLTLQVKLLATRTVFAISG